MGHLSGTMLSEAKELLLNTDAEEEEVDAADEIADGLVVDHAIANSVTEPPRHKDTVVISLALGSSWEQLELQVSHLGKLGVLLPQGVDKVLHLRHRKLPHTEQTLPRRNFVAEGAANLGGGEWLVNHVPKKKLS